MFSKFLDEFYREYIHIYIFICRHKRWCNAWLSRRSPSMTYFYSGDDLRHRAAVSTRDSYFTGPGRVGPGRRRRKFPFRVLWASVSCRRFHTFRPCAPRNANKQVSEPVSQTSKHVVAVSCRLVGAEVTRISPREFNSVDVEREKRGEGPEGAKGWASIFRYYISVLRRLEIPSERQISRSAPFQPPCVICRVHKLRDNFRRLVSLIPAVKSNNSRDSLSAYNPES